VLEAGRQEREGEGAKLDSSPTVELVLKLHPAGGDKKLLRILKY